MRITGGSARGIPLHLPRGDAVRPAMDRMRQAVFSSLGERVAGARFADLFAGSGSYGLEAWSRGAAGGVFVERDRKALACLRRNLEAVARSLGRSARECLVRPGDAAAFAPPPGERYDLIFLDPPYAEIPALAPRLFERCAVLLAEQPDARVVFEMPGELLLEPAGWECTRRLGGGGAGSSMACFYRRRLPEPAG